MKVEIVEKSENPLFQRVEIKFKVDHAGEPTPKRLDVRAQVAAQLGVPQELVVIEKLAGAYGRQEASGIARAYNSKERLAALEPKYLLARGLPKEAKVETKSKEEPKVEKPKKSEEKPEKIEEKKPEKPKDEAKLEKKAQEEKVKEVGKGG
jgi:small subunit ribosomal protein S24e